MAMLDAWFSFREDERSDAKKVAELEAMAAAVAARLDFVSATELIAEADGLRATWDKPRVKFASLAAMFAELEALAALAGAWDAAEPLSSGYDIRALRELGERASTVGVALEALADDIEAELEGAG